MFFKINNLKKIAYLLFLIAPLVIMVLFTVPIKAASNYNDCYDKKKSNQKNCLQSEYNKACKDKSGNKKEKCQKDESAKMDSAFDSAVSQCVQNQKLSKQECKDKFIKPSQIGGYVSSQNSDDGDGSQSGDLVVDSTEKLTQEEQDIKNYRCDPENTSECLESNPIVRWLNVLINMVAGIVGVGAVLMMIWAGIQYTTARGNAQAVADAKQKIINVVIGIAAFIFMWAFLNWLVPGGVFK